MTEESILITAIGGPDTNSLVTLVGAEAILAQYVGETLSADWEGCSQTQMEYRLITGCTILGMLPLRSKKAYVGQAAPFPRTHQADPTVYPVNAQEAQVLLAYDVVGRNALSPWLNPEDDDSEGREISSISVGGLSVSFSGNSPGATNLITRLIRTSQFPIMMFLKSHLASIRIRSFRTAEEREDDALDLLTYVED